MMLVKLKLQLKLKTNLHSAVKSEIQRRLTAGLVSWAAREGIWLNKNVLRRFLKATVNDAELVMSAGRLFHNVGTATAVDSWSSWHV